jgi:hypothetical protein
MLMVAPFTATLMASGPVSRAGVASAVNTAISDVGPQLAIALMFVVMTANFYGTMARNVPGLDVPSSIGGGDKADGLRTIPTSEAAARVASRDRLATMPARLRQWLTGSWQTVFAGV